MEKGIDGTTIKDIAETAGVSEGALYRHYKSKDDLAWHLFSRNLSEFTTHLYGSVLSSSNAKKRIQTFVTECFKAFEEDRDLFTFLVLSEHREFRKYPPTQIHPGHLILKIIRDGQEDGTVERGDPHILAALVLGGIIRISVVRILGGVQKSLKHFEKEVSDHLWRMINNE